MPAMIYIRKLTTTFTKKKWPVEIRPQLIVFGVVEIKQKSRNKKGCSMTAFQLWNKIIIF